MAMVVCRGHATLDLAVYERANAFLSFVDDASRRRAPARHDGVGGGCRAPADRPWSRWCN